MKPITILFLVLGLGIWLILTSYDSIIPKLFFSNMPDEMTSEVVMNGNYMSISAKESENIQATQIAKTALADSEDENASEVADLTDVNVDEVSDENSLLLAQNSVTQTDITLINSEESDTEQLSDVEELNEKQDFTVDIENEDSLQPEINAEQNVALVEKNEKQETDDTDLNADRDLEVEVVVKEPESATVQSEAEETNDVKTATTDADLEAEVKKPESMPVQSEAEESDDAKTTAASTPMAMPPMNPYMYNMWMPSMQNPMGYSWMNPMFNPYAYGMYMQMMMNPAVDSMTQAQTMDAMMRSMNPQFMFGMFGMPNYDPSKVPDQLPVVTIPGFPTQSYQNWPKNLPSESVSREAKMNAFQTAMAMSPLSMRNMVSMMTDKIPVAEDVSWDDAVEAMKLRANEINFKFVGSSPLWKQIEAETEEPSTKVEIFRFCDARVARKILDEVPEFIVFLPCRIALLEDADGKLWVMTLDWDVSWLDYAQNPNTHLPKDLREDAKRVRESIAFIMKGAATGDF